MEKYTIKQEWVNNRLSGDEHIEGTTSIITSAAVAYALSRVESIRQRRLLRVRPAKAPNEMSRVAVPLRSLDSSMCISLLRPILLPPHHPAHKSSCTPLPSRPMSSPQSPTFHHTQMHLINVV